MVVRLKFPCFRFKSNVQVSVTLSKRHSVHRSASAHSSVRKIIIYFCSSISKVLTDGRRERIQKAMRRLQESSPKTIGSGPESGHPPHRHFLAGFRLLNKDSRISQRLG